MVITTAIFVDATVKRRTFGTFVVVFHTYIEINVYIKQ